jgi:hypothetical protein
LKERRAMTLTKSELLRIGIALVIVFGFFLWFTLPAALCATTHSCLTHASWYAHPLGVNCLWSC